MRKNRRFRIAPSMSRGNAITHTRWAADTVPPRIEQKHPSEHRDRPFGSYPPDTSHSGIQRPFSRVNLFQTLEKVLIVDTFAIPANYLQLINIRGREAMKDVIYPDYICNGCNSGVTLQIDFASGIPLRDGCIPFPEDDRYHCPTCGTTHDMSELRRELESSFLESIKPSTP